MRSGRSLFISWSCRAMVLVDMTTRSPFCIAHSAAGMRYARDFPVPVPASTMRWLPLLKASATDLSTCTCWERCSKSVIWREKSPPGSSVPASVSISNSFRFSAGSRGIAGSALLKEKSFSSDFSSISRVSKPFWLCSRSRVRKGISPAQRLPSAERKISVTSSIGRSCRMSQSLW